MRIKRVPELNWPVHLFEDVGVLGEDDQFAQSADLGSTAEARAFSRDLQSVVRYHYAEAPHHAAIQ